MTVTRSKAEQRVVKAIVRQETETANLISKRVESLDVSKEKLKRALKNLATEVDAGERGRRDARQNFRLAFFTLALEEYLHDLPAVKSAVDRHLETQIDALIALDKPLTEVASISDEDLKADVSEDVPSGSA